MKPTTLMCSAAITLSIALVLPLQLSAQHTHYKLIDLGTLGGPNSQVNGTAPPMINNRGMVAGQADSSAPCAYLGGVVSSAFMWNNGVLTDLGVLPGGCFHLPDTINSKGMIAGVGDIGVLDPIWGPVIHADFRYKGQVLDLGTFGGNNSLASQVNDRGQVVGGAENGDPDPWNFGGNTIGLPSPTAWRAFLWQAGTMRDLGTLGGPDSFAMVINESGQVAGFSFTNSTPNPTTGIPTVDPFLWDGSRMIDLGTLGGTLGLVAGINSQGQVAGISKVAGDEAFHGYVWGNGVLTDLGTLGGDNVDVDWINDASQVVGVSDLADGTHHAFVWQNGTMTDIGTIAGDPCSNGHFINTRGQAVGTSTDCHGTILHSFLWENGSMVDLSSQVLPGSGFAFVEPVAIKNVGEIVGNGTLLTGDVHVVVLKPCSSECDAQIASNSNSALPANQIPRNSKATLREEMPKSPLDRVRAQMTQRYRLR